MDERTRCTIIALCFTVVGLCLGLLTHPSRKRTISDYMRGNALSRWRKWRKKQKR